MAKSLRHIYMVEKKDGAYRKVSRKQLLSIRSPIYLEGVDGNEQENTVTYWYSRRE